MPQDEGIFHTSRTLYSLSLHDFIPANARLWINFDKRTFSPNQPTNRRIKMPRVARVARDSLGKSRALFVGDVATYLVFVPCNAWSPAQMSLRQFLPEFARSF